MEIVDIIGEIVAAINNTFIVKTITDNGDGTYTITTNDTLHLQEGYPLTIDSNDYEIVTIVKDTSIKISGSVLPTVTSFEVYAPVYYHGTVIKVKSEIKNKTENVLARTPFIYLRELIEEDVNSKYSNSPIEKTADLQILFLTNCNYVDWKIDDHYEKAIAQMKNLVDRFMLAVYADVRIGEFESYKLTNHVNFGVYVTNEGSRKSVFNDNLTGIEMKISLPFLKQDCE